MNILELGSCNDCEKVKDKEEKRTADTWKDLFKQARECMKNKLVEDWRPAVNVFTNEFKDRSGIIMWMNNGDTIIYYPKEEKDEA